MVGILRLGSPRSLYLVTAAVVLSIAMGTYYHYYVDTLQLSEIVDTTGDNAATILVNLFDFDTGLTRHDIRRLSEKSPHWNRRIQEVAAIKDPARRSRAEEELVAEMMRDPAAKKVLRKLLGVGLKATGELLQFIASIV